jgi:8-oxo-dGTP pyrophosphatase MutT (NUDIX family)
MAISFSETYLGKIRKKFGKDFVIIATGANIVIENDKGELLLQLRTDDGRFDLLGGACDPMEDMLECAKREVKEESGLTIRSLRPFCYSCNPKYALHTYPNGDKIHGHTLVFCTNEFEGEFVKDEAETEDLVWFAPDQLPYVNMREEMVRILKVYFEYKKDGQFKLL